MTRPDFLWQLRKQVVGSDVHDTPDVPKAHSLAFCETPFHPERRDVVPYKLPFYPTYTIGAKRPEITHYSLLITN